jgi:hypothetical protein
MDDQIATMNRPQEPELTLSQGGWTRGVAAGSLLVSAVMLATGRRKPALALAAAGAAVALLENPEAVREFWNSIPRYLRAGQDFLVRTEDFVDQLEKQGVRLRQILAERRQNA